MEGQPPCAADSIAQPRHEQIVALRIREHLELGRGRRGSLRKLHQRHTRQRNCMYNAYNMLSVDALLCSTRFCGNFADNKRELRRLSPASGTLRSFCAACSAVCAVLIEAAERRPHAPARLMPRCGASLHAGNSAPRAPCALAHPSLFFSFSLCRPRHFFSHAFAACAVGRTGAVLRCVGACRRGGPPELRRVPSSGRACSRLDGDAEQHQAWAAHHRAISMCIGESDGGFAIHEVSTIGTMVTSGAAMQLDRTACIPGPRGSQ